MKIKLADYLYGDEAAGYRYRGEKTDEQKLRDLYEKLDQLIADCSERRGDLKYASSYDFEEIEYLESKCAEIRDRIAKLRAEKEDEEFYIEPEYISNDEKEIIDLDMDADASLNDERHRINDKNRKKTRHNSPDKQERAHRIAAKKRTIKRRIARRGKQEFERLAA